MARRESWIRVNLVTWMLLRATKVKALLSMYTDGVNISADHPIVIPDPEDERAPKKPRKPITSTKIWVGNSCGIFEIFTDSNFEALKLSDYTFFSRVAEISGYE